MLIVFSFFPYCSNVSSNVENSFNIPYRRKKAALEIFKKPFLLQKINMKTIYAQILDLSYTDKYTPSVKFLVGISYRIKI